MAHAFVSYVRENADQIDQLVLDLYKHGVDTWTDRDIRPGQRWKLAIRDAIKGGLSFIACFSAEAVSRDRSYMHEEITVAIEALREMPQDRCWFLPVLLSECEVPDRDIGAGHTLRDFQRVEMFPDWDRGVTSIVSAIRQTLRYEQPASPQSIEPRLLPLRNAPSPATVDAWRSVWAALFDLKTAGESLFTRIDERTMAEYASCLDVAIKHVGKSAFFFDQDDFEQLNDLLHDALLFQAGKATVFDALHDQRGVGWEYIVDAIRDNLAEFEAFCRLLSEIRNRYAVRMASSTQYLSRRGDPRSEQKIKVFEAAAARSKRMTAVRRAAALMIRRGEITLESECPRGHGNLREWEGVPRCWSCGWPWKDIEPLSR